MPKDKGSQEYYQKRWEQQEVRILPPHEAYRTKPVEPDPWPEDADFLAQLGRNTNE